jgi:ring-1,2-phenylacetyl-CoA epoxidase subunit PaaC
MDQAPPPFFQYLLRLADDALVIGHRLSEWCGHAPTLEEDIALANLALDYVGQARSLYQYAAVVEDTGRGEDDLAYLRDAGAYSNLLLLELPNGDFAVTITRAFLYAALMHPFWMAAMAARDERLAAIAAKAEKEAAYHLRHTAEWVIRLGDGTAESKRRMEDALDDLWRYTGEMFDMDGTERELAAAGLAVDRAALRGTWDATVNEVLRRATLARPKDGYMQVGGRLGVHTEHLGYILADMQFLQRAYPGATW